MAAPALRSFRVRVRAVAVGLAALTLAAALPAPPAAAGETMAPDSAEVKAAIIEGYQLLDRNQAQDAIREFRKADKLTGGASSHALVGLALSYNRIGSFSAAEKSVRRALELPLEPGQKIVGVSVDAGREEVEAYVHEHALGWTQAWDQGGANALNSFRVRSYPTYLLVDPDGRVILRLTGWSDRISGALTSGVKKAIHQAGKSAD